MFSSLDDFSITKNSYNSKVTIDSFLQYNPTHPF